MLHQSAFSAAETAVVRKAARHLIPFMALLYFVSFLDRVNIGYAALTMNADIGLSASAFGFGAGIFFIGYFLFEVPSNLILKRVGARRWIARIMLSWGILSAATAFVEGPVSFWIIRFLLGVAEAGFFPGMIYYLTYWFPSAVRGRVIGGFLIAVPLSSVLGAPVSTWLLETPMFGFAGWQTMFLLEGVPAALLGVVVLFVLPDRPMTASWLSDSEKTTLEGLLDKDRGPSQHTSLKAGLLSLNVWRFSLIYFGLVVGLYGFSFWSPQIIKALGNLSNIEVGIVSIVPYALAAVALYWWGNRSDQGGDRVLHLAMPAFLAAVAFAISIFVADPMLNFIALTVGAVGIYASLPVFWTLPTQALSGTAAAGGIALINSIGNLGGYAGPVVIGSLLDSTGGFAGGMLALAAAMLAAGLLALSVKWRNAG
ncbi:MFS transporter [Kordiimonas aestuarii]|uniref:MFS transporter n=1 Tax=Kordiimonas aestuarii TaxID=1005925 RepID=UPI0021D17114|nr:MFS transporter [Kordiimonas aestuarii]